MTTTICQDAFLEITKYLFYNKDIIRFLSINKAGHVSKERCEFCEMTDYRDELEPLSYYNRLKTIYRYDEVTDECCYHIPHVYSVDFKLVNKDLRLLLPYTVNEINLDYRFNQPLDGVVFPSSLQKLKLGGWFDQPLIPGIFSSLNVIIFSHNFNQTLPINIFPSSLQEITFGALFNKPLLPGVFPSSLQEIRFGRKFNRPLVPGVFPDSLKKITFDEKFNQPLLPGVLPPCLQEITFGWDFNQPLENPILPPSLQKITLFGNNPNRNNVSVKGLDVSVTVSII